MVTAESDPINHFYLRIDGQEVIDKTDYGLRFYKLNDKIVPTLYYHGKRVIQSWSISLIHSQPADKEGCSA